MKDGFARYANHEVSHCFASELVRDYKLVHTHSRPLAIISLWNGPDKKSVIRPPSKLDRFELANPNWINSGDVLELRITSLYDDRKTASKNVASACIDLLNHPC